MNAPPSNASIRGPLVAAIGLGLVFGGLFAGLLLGVGCSENVHPYTDTARVCDSFSAWDGFNWWLAVLGPARSCS